MPKDFNLNERNFNVRKGQTPFPVYTEHYNEAMDTLENVQVAITGAGGLSEFVTGSSQPKYTTTGAAGSGLTVVESGNEVMHQSKISGTLLDVSVATDAGVLADADIAFGSKLYDFPEGGIRVHNVVWDLVLTAVNSTETPLIGIGTVVATGATATFIHTATFADIITGVSAANAITSTGANSERVAAASGAAAAFDGGTSAKDAYLNVAGAWGATGSFTVTGDVYLTWSFLGDYS